MQRQRNANTGSVYSTPGRTHWIKQTTRTVSGEIADLRYAVDVNSLEKRPASQLAMNEVGHVLLSLTHDQEYATAFAVCEAL